MSEFTFPPSYRLAREATTTNRRRTLTNLLGSAADDFIDSKLSLTDSGVRAALVNAAETRADLNLSPAGKVARLEALASDLDRRVAAPLRKERDGIEQRLAGFETRAATVSLPAMDATRAILDAEIRQHVAALPPAERDALLLNRDAAGDVETVAAILRAPAVKPLVSDEALARLKRLRIERATGAAGPEVAAAREQWSVASDLLRAVEQIVSGLKGTPEKVAYEV